MKGDATPKLEKAVARLAAMSPAEATRYGPEIAEKLAA